MEAGGHHEIATIVGKELAVSPLATGAGCEMLELIAELEGITLTRKQLLAGAAISGSARAVDDVFDRGTVDEARIMGRRIELALTGNSGEKDALPSSVTRGIKIITDNAGESALATLAELSRAQSASIQQRTPGIKDAELEAITRKKGGNTRLSFALTVNPNLSEQRKICFKEWGYLCQLIDDYKDLDEDSQSGITTIIGKLNNSSRVLLIMNQYKMVRQLFLSEYGPIKARSFINYIDHSIARIGLATN